MVASFPAINKTFPAVKLVEFQPRVDARAYKGSLASARGGRVEIGAASVALVAYRAGPFFECPGCSRMVRFLHTEPELRCRRCAHLDFACRRTERSHRGEAKIAKIRRALGSEDGRPFLPIPPRAKGRRRLRYLILVRALVVEEEKLAASLAGVTSALELRIRSRKAKRARGWTKKALRAAGIEV